MNVLEFMLGVEQKGKEIKDHYAMCVGQGLAEGDAGEILPSRDFAEQKLAELDPETHSDE